MIQDAFKVLHFNIFLDKMVEVLDRPLGAIHFRVYVYPGAQFFGDRVTDPDKWLRTVLNE
jgi:hypothetical protein